MEKPKRDVDFLVVGQGIAGTVFSFLLRKNQHRFIVLDSEAKPAATDAAAGIMNPITGKHLALSWNYQELYPIATALYEDMCRELGLEIQLEKPVVRAFKSQTQLNDWVYRSSQQRYAAFMTSPPNTIQNEPRIKTVVGRGATANSFQIPIHELRKRWKSHLMDKAVYLEDSFDYSAVAWEGGYGMYKDIKFKHLVCSEGAYVKHNPYFNYLPFDPAKGEALIIRINDWYNDIIYKGNVFIAPWDGEELFWVGGTYAWHTENPYPTAEKKAQLITQLESMFDGDYEIVDQVAGLRPATKDRKPIIGSHPDIQGLYILNGMGTKGTSLSPYCAKQLYNQILHKAPIDPEISIDRFTSSP